jgi:hypothetical protein
MAKPQEIKHPVCITVLVMVEKLILFATNIRGMLVPNIINPILKLLVIWLAVITSASNTPMHK